MVCFFYDCFCGGTGTIFTFSVLCRYSLVCGLIIYKLSVFNRDWGQHKQPSYSYSSAMLLLLLLLFQPGVHSVVSNDDNQNLTEYVCNSPERNRYFNGFVYVQCRSAPQIIIVQPLICLTYHRDEIVAGRCLLPSRAKRQRLNSNVTLDSVRNGSTCNDPDDDSGGGGGYNGTLCGECDRKSRPSINSFGLVCLPISSCAHHVSWFIYFLIRIAPLTVFYCIILVFRIRVTAGAANLFVFFAQVVTIPNNVVFIDRDLAALTNNKTAAMILTNVLSLLYGIWNLNFLRGIGLFPGLCSKEHHSSIQLLTLDYVTAVYPLFLIAITYLLIELHARNFRLIVLVWKPFHKVLVHFSVSHPNARRSVVDAFSTFVLLSYAKFAHTSLAILAPTPLYNLTNDEVGMVSLYDTTLEYFKPPHTYFAIAAIVVLVVFVVPPPLVLLLYPMKWFQRCLDVCRLRNNLLTAFTDAYLGCYKDGLNGTRDCRYFAGLYFIYRVVVFALYAFVSDYSLRYFLIHTTIAIVVALVAIFMPYKNNFFNKLDLLLSGLYILLTSAAIYNNSLVEENHVSLWFTIFFYLLIITPLVYVSIFGSFWFLSRIYSKSLCCFKTPQKLVTFFQNSDISQNSLITPLTEGEAESSYNRNTFA